MKEVSPQSILAEWANKQDNWVRGIVREVLSTHRGISQNQAEAFYELFLVEKRLKDGEVTSFPVIGTEAVGEDGEPALSLVRLENVENVNALAPGQRIDFNAGVTVVFGENATGKTGYVRILKRMASVRSAEEILPNLSGGGASPAPRASVVYLLGDQETSAIWSNEEGLYPFTRLDIFDARAAELHVDEELTYVYTPRDLSLFKMVMDAIEGVRVRLEKARDEIGPKGNPFLVRFARESVVYPEMETLGASTDLTRTGNARRSLGGRGEGPPRAAGSRRGPAGRCGRCPAPGCTRRARVVTRQPSLS